MKPRILIKNNFNKCLVVDKNGWNTIPKDTAIPLILKFGLNIYETNDRGETVFEFPESFEFPNDRGEQ